VSENEIYNYPEQQYKKVLSRVSEKFEGGCIFILCYNVIYRFPNNLFLQSYESFPYETVELVFFLNVKFWIESMSSSLLLDHFLITFYSIDFADENEEEDEEQEEEMELEEEEEEDEEYNTEYIEVNRIFNIKTIENFFIGF
jgi:hypothetical protein